MKLPAGGADPSANGVVLDVLQGSTKLSGDGVALHKLRGNADPPLGRVQLRDF